MVSGLWLACDQVRNLEVPSFFGQFFLGAISNCHSSTFSRSRIARSGMNPHDICRGGGVVVVVVWDSVPSGDCFDGRAGAVANGNLGCIYGISSVIEEGPPKTPWVLSSKIGCVQPTILLARQPFFDTHICRSFCIILSYLQICLLPDTPTPCPIRNCLLSPRASVCRFQPPEKQKQFASWKELLAFLDRFTTSRLCNWLQSMWRLEKTCCFLGCSSVVPLL